LGPPHPFGICALSDVVELGPIGPVFSGTFPGTFVHVTEVTVAGAATFDLFRTSMSIVFGMLASNLQELLPADDGTRFAMVAFGIGAHPAKASTPKPSQEENRMIRPLQFFTLTSLIATSSTAIAFELLHHFCQCGGYLLRQIVFG